MSAFDTASTGAGAGPIVRAGTITGTGGLETLLPLPIETETIVSEPNDGAGEGDGDGEGAGGPIGVAR